MSAQLMVLELPITFISCHKTTNPNAAYKIPSFFNNVYIFLLMMLP